MKNRYKTILIVVAALITIFLFLRMRESYEGDVGPTLDEEEEDKTEEDIFVKRMVEEKGITQDDLDALSGLIQKV
tara:strand:+ start:311 stop:535 length:225 start_codon:yes stop_codon:yes gene_type:complete